jgi:hypothetical protein
MILTGLVAIIPGSGEKSREASANSFSIDKASVNVPLLRKAVRSCRTPLRAPAHSSRRSERMRYSVSSCRTRQYYAQNGRNDQAQSFRFEALSKLLPIAIKLRKKFFQVGTVNVNGLLAEVVMRSALPPF